MTVYYLQRQRWDMKPSSMFGQYEYGWVDCKFQDRTLTKVFTNISKLNKYVSETYKLKDVHFKNIKIGDIAEIQYITPMDRYKLIVRKQELN